MIWKRKITLEALNAMGEGNMVGLLDIRFEHIGDDTLEATMPVDSRTKQPFGLLHGGASVVLAESIGSVAGYLCTEGEQKVVGLDPIQKRQSWSYAWKKDSTVWELAHKG